MCEACDLIVVRHEEADGNVAMSRSKFFGDSSAFTDEMRAKSSHEWRLTSNGRERTVRLARWVNDALPLNRLRLVVSPSRRAIETAEMILPEPTWKIMRSVRGRLWGGIEQLPWKEWGPYCKKHGVDKLPSGFYEAYPNGESMDAVYRRTRSFLRRMSRSTLVVTHGEVLVATRMILEGRGVTSYPTIERNGRHIRNGHVIWYSRRNPETGICSETLDYKREYYDGIESPWEKLNAG